MHTLLDGAVQYELWILLLSYIKSKHFTLEELNNEIISFDFGYSEIGDKFGPLYKSVFTGDERSKLKYNAAQNCFCDCFPIYSLILSINHLQLVFSPVISKGTVTALEGQTEEHLKLFKQLFPNKNITPKQHCVIHIPSHIISLGAPTRASGFSFESAHNYFKELARNQNFRTFPVSLAKRHQKIECCNFINNQLHHILCLQLKNVWCHKIDGR